jgi:hypothetical protein
VAVPDPRRRRRRPSLTRSSGQGLRLNRQANDLQQVVRRAVWEVTVKAFSEGDWRPSMNWLDVIELLDE